MHCAVAMTFLDYNENVGREVVMEDTKSGDYHLTHPDMRST